MTEAEWRTRDDADHMLAVARRRKVRVGQREQRMLACALCRLIWNRLDPVWREAVEAAEAFADGAVGASALVTAHGKAAARHRRPTPSVRAEWPGGVDWSEAKFAWEAAEGASRPRCPQPGKTMFAVRVCLSDGAAASTAAIADVLRDIIGNPFRLVIVPPTVRAWNDSVVVRLAQAAYEQRNMPEGTLDNGLLAILADALEEAGCTNQNILSHCREPGKHVRGCWVLDLCLGKS